MNSSRAGEMNETAPPGRSPRDTVNAQVDQLDSEFADAMLVAEAAIHRVVSDREVWAAEERRTAEPLPWPLLDPGTGLVGVLRWLATATVATALEAMNRSEPDDPNEREFQIVLRVCKRAVDEAETVLLPLWSRQGRRDGFRDFMNLLKRRRMDEVARSGLTGKRAAEEAGLSVASSYRAQHRKPRKKR